MAGYFLAIFAVIGGINAYNMMDGIDGLTGSMALVSLIALIILFAAVGATGYTLWALMFAVAIVPYLFANLKLFGFKRKIFMGDAGSMLLGFVIVWLLILGTQQETKYFRTVTALWIISVPLMDMAAIMIRRVRKGNSPFKPDRKHLHHIFLHAGLNSRQALAVIVVAAVLLTSIGIAGELWQVPEWIMLVGFLCLFAGYYYSLHRICKIVRWVRKSKSMRK
jgi:UDP-GlcNAc:undecaprenyl-phosphate GlcNAc-1-phosphate transferase